MPTLQDPPRQAISRRSPAGLAASGKTAFASTFGVFASGRCWEQIRMAVAYPKLNVKIVATHCGLSVGPDGATHQALEDIAVMRSLPKFQIGKATVMREGDDVSIIACGQMVGAALEAAETLASEGISAEVVNMSTIKPLDSQAVIDSVSKTGCCVTAEEHSIIGGLGSAVAECLCESVCAPLERVGTKDTFGESGKPADLMVKYGLTADDIVAAAKKSISRKA